METLAYNSKMIFVVCFIIYLIGVLSTLVGGFPIGVCYGIKGDNLPSPNEVISIFKSQKIKRIRLYEPNDMILEALRKSGIEVLVGVPNEKIQNIANSYDHAYKWVEKNIEFYYPDIHFRYISVGNNAIPGHHAHYVLLAMRHLDLALKNASLSSHIKVSTAVSISVLLAPNLPSSAVFSKDTIEFMRPIAHFLRDNKTPLLANIYPYHRYMENRTRTSLRYALFLSAGIQEDGCIVYRNSFDIMVDALHLSLKKVGAADVKIVVSETGWPSKKGLGTKSQFAQLYLSNLVKHVSSPHGTPRQVRQIETYLYAMFDENQKQSQDDEKRWGLYHPDKTPIYDVSFN